MFSWLQLQQNATYRPDPVAILLLFCICILYFESNFTFNINQMVESEKFEEVSVKNTINGSTSNEVIAKNTGNGSTFNEVIAKNKNASTPIYIIAAYLIREDFLRVILIMNCRAKMKIYAAFSNNQSAVKVAAESLSIISEACPIGSPCTYDGMYAEFKLPSKLVGNQVILDVVDNKNQSSSASITVHRSVYPNQRKHRLAVCVPALFYISNTVQLIEFIEIWLLAGATKFFFYWQAITPEIKNILSFYQASGIDLEMVAWPHLPNTTADQSVYYSGQIISINDCLHKARSQAEFAAVIDLDELIVVADMSEFLGKSTNLIQVLNATKPSAAGKNLSRMNAHFDIRPVYSNDPKELSFSSLGKIHHDKPGSAFNKLILRPENVRRSSVHWITELEPMAEGINSVPLAEATLVHLRPTNEIVDQKHFITSGFLAERARKITENWKRRLNNLSDEQLKNLTITQAISDIAQEMERCLLKLKGQMTSTCFTASHCVSILKNNTDTVVDWQYPEKEWIEM